MKLSGDSLDGKGRRRLYDAVSRAAFTAAACCPSCGLPLDLPMWTCVGCGARHHADCGQQAGCASPTCLPEARAPRIRIWVALAIGLLLVGLALRCFS